MLMCPLCHDNQASICLKRISQRAYNAKAVANPVSHVPNDDTHMQQGLLCLQCMIMQLDAHYMKQGCCE